jgi:serine/threonine-protein kinase
MLPHPDLFFGRTALVRRLFRRLGSERPQSVSVVGERRIGKSSLLNFLRSPRARAAHLDAPDRFFFALIDFQQLRSLDEAGFYAAVFAAVQKQSEGVLALDLEPSQEGMRLLCETLTERGFRLVLLFDEFECVTKNEHFGAPFYSLLRSLANTTALAFVTASARPLKDMCVSHQIADSPFFNIFATQHLGLFTEDEGRLLVVEPSQARGVPLAPLADEILTTGGLYPFFLQMACSAWFDFLEMGGEAAAGYAGRPAPREVLEAFREEAAPHFEYVLETLPAGERAALSALVRGGPVNEAAVESLERKGYVAALPGGRAPFCREMRRFLERQA